MNKLMFFDNKLKKKINGNGNSLLVEKNENYIFGKGVSPLLIEEKKEDLIIGKGVQYVNNINKIKKKPIKLML